MKKTIVIFTNVERQYQRLNQAVRYLNREKLICSDCISLFFNSETNYSEAIGKLMLHSSVVFFLWQGAVYPTEFSNACKRFLLKNQKRFIMGSSTQPEVEAVHEVDVAALAQVSQYIFNSGTENYRNLWLYLCVEFAGEEVSYLPPAAFPWMGVADLSYGKIKDDSAGSISGTDAAECIDDPRPLVGILFARENWIWQEVAYLKELVNALEDQGLRTLPV
ncbi:MAG TPA: hypothetical protein DEG55_03720, partial [Acidaminococcaceae bacterium]|nr:hypothetical protein [Acidaminococcaceae bacterium]